MKVDAIIIDTFDSAPIRSRRPWAWDDIGNVYRSRVVMPRRKSWDDVRNVYVREAGDAPIVVPAPEPAPAAAPPYVPPPPIMVASSTVTGLGSRAYIKWLWPEAYAYAKEHGLDDPYKASTVGANYLQGVPGIGIDRARAMYVYARDTYAALVAKGIGEPAGVKLIFLAREALRKEAAAREKTADVTMATFAGIATAFAGPVGGYLVDSAYKAWKSLGQKLSGASGDTDEDIANLEASIKRTMQEGYPPPSRAFGWGEFSTAVALRGLVESYADMFRALTNAEREDVRDYWTTYLFFANEDTVKPYARVFPSAFSLSPRNDEQVMLVASAYATRFKFDVTDFCAAAWNKANPAGNYAQRIAQLARWCRTAGGAPLGETPTNTGGGGGGDVLVPALGIGALLFLL